jgi:hypothetical protein
VSAEVEWVPIVDTATRWPGLLWWDARGELEERRQKASHD